MANYSAEEIRAFKLKDVLNSRMSALKASATNNEGHKAKSVEVIREADEYYEWLRQDQDLFVTGKDGSTIVGEHTDEPVVVGSRAPQSQLPEPTLAQKKVIDAIAGKLGLLQADLLLKTRILEWAKAVHGQDSYPTKAESVDTFINWYNN